MQCIYTHLCIHSMHMYVLFLCIPILFLCSYVFYVLISYYILMYSYSYVLMHLLSKIHAYVYECLKYLCVGYKNSKIKEMFQHNLWLW